MTLTVNQLKTKLDVAYHIKDMIDLADLTADPGAAMKYFSALYQSEYGPNDRIVIYSSHDVPSALWKHIYGTVNFLDISNFFVLFCGSADQESAMKLACEQYSTDPVCFQFHLIDLETTKSLLDRYELPETMCAIPWTNLQIFNDGNISPCCMTTDATIGNITSMTLEQAFNSESMQNLRQSLLNGEKPKQCSNCWKLEDRGLTSIRTHNLKRLKHDLLTKYLHLPQITTLDLKFGYTCNFKCRICDSGSSSLFAQEEHKFKGIPLKPVLKWEESENFLSQIEHLLPQLTNIDMYGGEPFLLKKFGGVLKMAIEKGFAKNIRLHYNSNGSVWPRDFLDLWPHFKSVDILFSIDDLGKRFELQRGGKWADVEKNILDLKELNIANLSINIMPTISVMNVYYIDELYDWATKHGFQLVVSHVRSRRGLELSGLTTEAKKILIEKYTNHPWTEMQRVIDIIKTSPDSDGKLFCQSTRWFDEIRNEQFGDSHSEIAKAMGYI